jgi:hypothetical protein
VLPPVEDCDPELGCPEESEDEEGDDEEEEGEEEDEEGSWVPLCPGAWLSLLGL